MTTSFPLVKYPLFLTTNSRGVLTINDGDYISFDEEKKIEESVEIENILKKLIEVFMSRDFLVIFRKTTMTKWDMRLCDGTPHLMRREPFFSTLWEAKKIEDFFCEKRLHRTFRIHALRCEGCWCIAVRRTVFGYAHSPNTLDLIDCFYEMGISREQTQEHFKKFKIIGFAYKRDITENARLCDMRIRYDLNPYSICRRNADGPISYIDRVFGESRLRFPSSRHYLKMEKKRIVRNSPLIEMAFEDRSTGSFKTEIAIPQLVWLDCGVEDEMGFMEDVVKNKADEGLLFWGREKRDWLEIAGKCVERLREFGIKFDPESIFEVRQKVVNRADVDERIKFLFEEKDRFLTSEREKKNIFVELKLKTGLSSSISFSVLRHLV